MPTFPDLDLVRHHRLTHGDALAFALAFAVGLLGDFTADFDWGAVLTVAFDADFGALAADFAFALGLPVDAATFFAKGRLRSEFIWWGT